MEYLRQIQAKNSKAIFILGLTALVLAGTVFGSVSTANLMMYLLPATGVWYAAFMVAFVDISTVVFGGLKRFHAENKKEIMWATVGFYYSFIVNIVLLAVYFALPAGGVAASASTLWTIRIGIALHIGLELFFYWSYVGSDSEIVLRQAMNSAKGELKALELTNKIQLMQSQQGEIANIRAGQQWQEMRTALLDGYSAPQDVATGETATRVAIENSTPALTAADVAAIVAQTLQAHPPQDVANTTPKWWETANAPQTVATNGTGYTNGTGHQSPKS